MKKTLLFSVVILGLTLTAKAQKGNNQLQVSGQVAIPTGDLADVAKTGFGGTVKGIYGFSQKKQQVTLEAGYNRLAVKNLPSGVDASYSAFPIYTSYRYTFGNFVLEPQAGISINRVAGSAGSASVSKTKTNFGWATGVSYLFNKIELGVRYQSSEITDGDENLTFVGIRLGYNFSL